MADTFDPYHKWLGIPPRDQPPHHYRLLAIDLFESDPEVIDGAARRLVAFVKNCAGGSHAAAAKMLLAEILAARQCLLDPQLRAAYDQRLTAPPAAPAAAGSAPAAPPNATPASSLVEPPRVKKPPVASAGAAPATSDARGTPPANPVRKVLRARSVAASDTPSADALDAPPVSPIPTASRHVSIAPTAPLAPPVASRRKREVSSAPSTVAGQLDASPLGVPLGPGKRAQRPSRRKRAPAWVVALAVVGAVAVVGGIVVAVSMYNRATEDSGTEQDGRDLAASENAAGQTGDGQAGEGKFAEAKSDAEVPAQNRAAAWDGTATLEDDDAPAATGKRDRENGKSGIATRRVRGFSNWVKGSKDAAAGGDPEDLLALLTEDVTEEELEKQLAAGAELENKDKQGRTPLRLAVAKRRPDLVASLLKAKADANAADDAGATPLMSAAQAGDTAIVKQLLAAGANPNAQTKAHKKSGGSTALHVAARHGQAAVVDLLLGAGAQPDLGSKTGVTPLMVAAWQGQLPIVKTLIAKKANLTAKDAAGQTPLMYAAQGGSMEVVQLLLDNNVQAGERSLNGATALSMALAGKNPEVVVKLRQAIKDSAPVLNF